MIQKDWEKIIPRYGGYVGLYFLGRGLEDFQLSGAADGLAPVSDVKFLEDMF
jgi:hypothetical protein